MTVEHRDAADSRGSDYSVRGRVRESIAMANKVDAGR